jgi:hypothetical protein
LGAHGVASEMEVGLMEDTCKHVSNLRKAHRLILISYTSILANTSSCPVFYQVQCVALE